MWSILLFFNYYVLFHSLLLYLICYSIWIFYCSFLIIWLLKWLINEVLFYRNVVHSAFWAMKPLESYRCIFWNLRKIRVAESFQLFSKISTSSFDISNSTEGLCHHPQFLAFDTCLWFLENITFVGCFISVSLWPILVC